MSPLCDCFELLLYYIILYYTILYYICNIDKHPDQSTSPPTQKVKTSMEFVSPWQYEGVSKSFRNHPKVKEPETSILYSIHKSSLKSHYAKLHIPPTLY